MATAVVSTRLRVYAWITFSVALVLAVGWPVAAAIDWDSIADSHARLGYVVCDFCIVIPLGFLTWYGLLHGKAWGRLTFLVVAGAMAFDLLHFSVYLSQIEFVGLPPAVIMPIGIAGTSILGLMTWAEIRAQA